jgi:hypothetical protein
VTTSLTPYQAVVLRCVPRVDREEFLNVAVVLHCEAHDVLDLRTRVDAERLHAVAADLDLEMLACALEGVAAVCAGTPEAWPGAAGRSGDRFRWVAAPRSTVLQPGPVHGGLTDDPRATLDALAGRLLG